MIYIEKENLINWMMKEARKRFDTSMDFTNHGSKERLNAWQMDRAIMGLARTLVHGENFDKILSGHSSEIEVPGGSEKKEVNDGQ